MFPKMIPFSVEETLTLALIEQKSNGPMTTGDGRSTNFKSPKVANSKVTFCNVSLVWFTIKTSRTMSYWWTWTYASAYTGSLNPVSWVTLLNLEELKTKINFFREIDILNCKITIFRENENLPEISSTFFLWCSKSLTQSQFKNVSSCS